MLSVFLYDVIVTITVVVGPGFQDVVIVIIGPVLLVLLLVLVVKVLLKVDVDNEQVNAS